MTVYSHLTQSLKEIILISRFESLWKDKLFVKLIIVSE